MLPIAPPRLPTLLHNIPHSLYQPIPSHTKLKSLAAGLPVPLPTSSSSHLPPPGTSLPVSLSPLPLLRNLSLCVMALGCQFLISLCHQQLLPLSSGTGLPVPPTIISSSRPLPPPGIGLPGHLHPLVSPTSPTHCSSACTSPTLPPMQQHTYSNSSGHQMGLPPPGVVLSYLYCSLRSHLPYTYVVHHLTPPLPVLSPLNKKNPQTQG